MAYFDPYMQAGILAPGMPAEQPEPFQADPTLQRDAQIMSGLAGVAQLGGYNLANPFQNEIDKQRAQYDALAQKRMGYMSGQGLPSGVREYMYYSNLSPEEQKAYDRMKRGDQRTSLGKNADLYSEYFDDETALKIADGQYVLSEQDGANRLIDQTTGEVIFEAINADQAEAIRAGQKGAETTAQKSAEQVAADMARLREIAVGGVAFDQTMSQIDGWVEKLEGGDLQTGLVSGFLTELGLAGSELEGEALADSVEQALYNLQITNLAPVTEKEIQFIKGLFMDLKSPTEVNVGKLKAALKRLSRQVEVADYEAQGARDYILEFGDDRQKGFVNQFFPAPVSLDDALTEQGL